MIYDRIEQYKLYLGIHPRLDRALTFLAETDFSQVANGRVELEGDEVFANVMDCSTVPDNPTPEGHQTYIDVQYLIEGEEIIRVVPLCEAGEPIESHPDKDLWLYRSPGVPCPIGSGRFLVLFPTDAHAPNIAVDQPRQNRKCVVKVKMW